MSQGVDAKRGIEEIRRIKKENYSINMIIVLICEAIIKDRNNEPITRTERFFAGLRFCDYFAIELTPEAYVLAEIKRNEYLAQLGLTASEVDILCNKYGNI